MDKKVLVYTMGKVGSTTVMRALQSASGFAVDRGYKANLSQFDLDSFDAIITMVRDPIARNISQYWEDCTTLRWTTKTGEMQRHPTPDDFDTFCLYHTMPPQWFYHFEAIFGIDIMARNFNRKVGYAIYDNRYLVIRTESLSFELDFALAAMFSRHPDEFKVEHRAIGEQKFGPEYAEFVKNAKFDDEFLDAAYDNDWMRHFYYQKEINAMRRRWKK